MRAKAALDAGQAALARILARSLPESKAAPINQWAGLIEQPRASVEALIANPSRSVDREALLDGWQRYARADPEAAADRYAALVQARGLDARSASPFAIAVGLRLALARNARALEFFSLGHPDDFDEQAHEWHARAALWAGDWPRVRKAIEAMPDSLRGQNRWKYWAARSAEQAGDSSIAQQGYASVCRDRQLVCSACVRTSRQAVRPDAAAGWPQRRGDGSPGGRGAVRAHARAHPLRHAERSHRGMARGLRRADADRAGAGNRHRRPLDLVPAGDLGRGEARHLQRLRPAVPATLRPRGPPRRRHDRAAAGPDLRDHPAGEPVPCRRAFERGRTGADAAAAGDRATDSHSDGACRHRLARRW